MGCNQSQNILNIDLSQTNANKSDIAKLIIEEYDQMLVEIQSCRKQIQQTTGIHMNEHSLGEYKSDYILLNSFVQQSNQDKTIENISQISEKLKCLSIKYTNIKQQLNHLFDQQDLLSDYCLQLQWKDQVLFNYFFDHQKLKTQSSTVSPHSLNSIESPKSRKQSSTTSSKGQNKTHMSSSTKRSSISQKADQNYNRIIKSNFF